MNKTNITTEKSLNLNSKSLDLNYSVTVMPPTALFWFVLLVILSMVFFSNPIWIEFCESDTEIFFFYFLLQEKLELLFFTLFKALYWLILLKHEHMCLITSQIHVDKVWKAGTLNLRGIRFWYYFYNLCPKFQWQWC